MSPSHKFVLHFGGSKVFRIICDQDLLLVKSRYQEMLRNVPLPPKQIVNLIQYLLKNNHLSRSQKILNNHHHKYYQLHSVLPQNFSTSVLWWVSECVKFPPSLNIYHLIAIIIANIWNYFIWKYESNKEFDLEHLDN